MNPSLHAFAWQLARVVIAVLMPVALVAFLTIPFHLGGHPGEQRLADAAAPRHMT